MYVFLLRLRVSLKMCCSIVWVFAALFVFNHAEKTLAKAFFAWFAWQSRPTPHPNLLCRTIEVVGVQNTPKCQVFSASVVRGWFVIYDTTPHIDTYIRDMISIHHPHQQRISIVDSRNKRG